MSREDAKTRREEWRNSFASPRLRVMQPATLHSRGVGEPLNMPTLWRAWLRGAGFRQRDLDGVRQIAHQVADLLFGEGLQLTVGHQ